MNNPIQITNLNPNEVSVVLPDGTTVYGPVQSVIAAIKGIKAPAKADPVALVAPKQVVNYDDPVALVAPKQVVNYAAELNVFSQADRRILSVYSRDEIARLEHFMAYHSHLLNWKDKVVPKMHTIYDVDPDTLPIRGKKYCYIDCYGNVFSCLDAVAEYYRVKSIGEAPQMSFSWYAKMNADKIKIPEFTDGKDAYIFWHLNFNNYYGKKVSIVRADRGDIYEWYKNIDNPAVARSRRIHQFSNFAIYVMHARAHVGD